MSEFTDLAKFAQYMGKSYDEFTREWNAGVLSPLKDRVAQYASSEQKTLNSDDFKANKPFIGHSWQI